MHKIVATLSHVFNRQKKPAIVLLGLGGILLLSALDYLSGYEYAFSIFYLFPIMLVTWYLGQNEGIIFSLISAGAWSIANHLAGETFSSPLISPFNALTRLVFFLVVVFLLHRVRRSLEIERKLSRTDPLTGALNSRAFYEIAANRLERCRRKERPLSLAYIDLDNFKYINDRLGHLKGDETLRIVAETLRSTLRSTDIVARMGGDEFVVLLPNSYPEAAQHAIERARLELGKRMQQEQWPVTISIGLVTSDCSKDELDIETLIRSADDAMYVAKRKGKNTLDQNLLD
jgi:diguanylate cyclase (GGDEF)-like protein